MSKIYRPNMTAQDVLNAFSSDKAYAAKAKELKDILSAIDSRVGLVETQSQADKLLAQAESTKAEAEAEKKNAEKQKAALAAEVVKFEAEIKTKRAAARKSQTKANALDRSVTSRETEANSALAAREAKVLQKEQTNLRRGTELDREKADLKARKSEFEGCLADALQNLQRI